MAISFKPITVIIPENIPVELKQRTQWVCWRYEFNPTNPEKPKKVPINPNNGLRARVNNPATWTDFQTALEAAAYYDGIGFVFTDEDPLVGCDLDDVFDPVTGEMDPGAHEICQLLDTYIEFSPSGTGLHLIAFGKIPCAGRKRPGIEIYQAKHFFCITGFIAPGARRTIEDGHLEVRQIYDRFFSDTHKRGCRTTYGDVDSVESKSAKHGGTSRCNDTRPIFLLHERDQELIDRACKSKDGIKFSALYKKGDWNLYYPSQSEGDLGLCEILAFWCGNDPVRVDRLFRHSKLYRDKWDQKRGQTTYGWMTIEEAISRNSVTYAAANPNRKRILKFIETVKAALAIDAGNPFWKGPGGSTRRAVLQAHHKLMSMRLYYGASVREVAEAAGISGLGTVGRANQALEDEGWIMKVIHGTANRASIYVPNVPVYVLMRLRGMAGDDGELVHSLRSQYNTTCDLKECVNPPPLPSNYVPFDVSKDAINLDSPACDVWRWKGLGKTKYNVWSALNIDAGNSLKELAARLNKQPSTLREQLNCLAKYGLAKQLDGLWYKRYLDLATLAAKLGVGGTLQRQQVRHKADRIRYQEHLRFRAATVSMDAASFPPRALGRRSLRRDDTSAASRAPTILNIRS
jgi:hypothetical protein